MPLTPGSLLVNRYQILRSLKQGGMGEIYLALDRNLNVRVAIKESFSTDALANSAFQQEAQILATLAHPNLPRVTNFFIEPNGARYLVMDFIEGHNLEELVKPRGALPTAEALARLRAIFGATKYLHAQPYPIIHRDINPRNIIIKPDGKPVLVDFGIAKVLIPGQVMTRGLTGYGTPGYAPPEQYSGGTDQRTDVYALGATLYFAMTGQTPPDTPLRAAGTALAPMSQFNPQVPPQVAQAILKAMNLNSAQRFASIADLERALYAPATRPVPIPPLARAAPTLTASNISPQQPAPFVGAQTNDWWRVAGASIVGGILIAALLIGCLFLTGFLGGASPTPTPTRIANLTATPTSPFGPTLPPVSPTTAPPGATLSPIVPTHTPPGVTTPPIVPTDTPLPDTPTPIPTPIPTATELLSPTPTDTPIPLRVIDVSVAVAPSSSSTCPTTFDFTGTITTIGVGNISYQWIHSDGSVGPVQTLTFLVEGIQNVAPDSWTLGAPGFDFGGWTQLRALSPNVLDSNQASFSIHCPIPPTSTPTFTPVPPGLPRGWILFSSDRSGSNQLYVMDRSGGNVRQITTNVGPNEDGAAASDRQRIVMTHLYSINNGDLFGMNLAGGAPYQLTQGTVNWGASWSPDGSRIVFYSLRDGGKQIYVMNADGSNQHRISSADCTGKDTDDWSPAWSRNGALIVYESIPHKACEGGGTADIFVSDPNGGGKRNVTRSAGIDDESPNWSPDGRIVFTSTRNGNYDIFVINADGSGLQQLTNGPEDDDYPAWSPDGSAILFQRRQNGNWEIYAMNADGSNLRNLTNHTANETFGEWVQ